MADRIAINDLSELGEVSAIRCDVLIIGGGPAGLTVARGLAGLKRDILILESGGLSEDKESDALNAVVADADNWTPAQAQRRVDLHGTQTKFWNHDEQGFGMRCRGLGGSTAAWAGKSASFDSTDFAARSWVANSGWPIRFDDVSEYLDRAAETLNLGVNCYDDRLWALMRRAPPEPAPDKQVLQSFFWQIARSRLDPMEVMRTGAEFVNDAPEGCRVLTHATVLEILTDAAGGRATGVVVADIAGTRRRVSAEVIVLAASAIENARLMLVSRAKSADGLGNPHDTVGRYLMDHPDAVVAAFEPAAIKRMAQHYGFYALKSASGVNMYMRGLAPTPAIQEAEGLLNCAVFMPGERAPDDPWSAAKRIAKRRSESYLSDAWSILKAPGTVAKGLGRLAFQSPSIPKVISGTLINQIVRFAPNLAVEEYLSQGVPVKLVGLSIQAICEQAPDPNNRIYLSNQTDRFGTPLPAARWRIGDMETRTLIRTAQIMRDAFAKAGLPQPVLEDWVLRGDTSKAAITDMAHTAGTTRMSNDPRRGVVDANCKVHGLEGLYVAGASVFSTSGHANPTLMIMAFAYRLAAHIRTLLRPAPTLEPAEKAI